MADNAWASWATVVRSWSMSSEFAKPYVDGFGEAAMQRPRIGSGTAAVCLAFIADGVVVGTDGLPASVPNLISWATLILFAVTATIAPWWRHGEHQPAEVADPGH